MLLCGLMCYPLSLDTEEIKGFYILVFDDNLNELFCFLCQNGLFVYQKFVILQSEIKYNVNLNIR